MKKILSQFLINLSFIVFVLVLFVMLVYYTENREYSDLLFSSVLEERENKIELPDSVYQSILTSEDFIDQYPIDSSVKETAKKIEGSYDCKVSERKEKEIQLEILKTTNPKYSIFNKGIYKADMVFILKEYPKIENNLLMNHYLSYSSMLKNNLSIFHYTRTFLNNYSFKSKYIEKEIYSYVLYSGYLSVYYDENGKKIFNANKISYNDENDVLSIETTNFKEYFEDTKKTQQNFHFSEDYEFYLASHSDKNNEYDLVASYYCEARWFLLITSYWY